MMEVVEEALENFEEKVEELVEKGQEEVIQRKVREELYQYHLQKNTYSQKKLENKVGG